MSEMEIVEDRAKLKQGLVKVLQCVATISSAAAVVNPIFGLAGSLIRVVLHHVDDEDIQTLKREFGSVNRALDQLSQQNRGALLQIKKETLDGQYCRVEENLRNQFRKFMEMVEARPEHCERKKDDFEESYSNDLGDQNLHTLYEGVVGKPKLFSRPILEVYLKHSQGDRRTMENLCTRLTYLFCIGLIALMGYAAVIGDDEEGISDEWTKKMEHVQERMQEALQKWSSLLASSKWMVSIEGRVVCVLENQSNFAAALSVLFGCFYVFNTEYQETASATLEFIQRCLVGINPNEGTKCSSYLDSEAGVSRRTGRVVQRKTDAVAAFLKDLTEFEW
ncbi:protein rapunzel-like isoform X1 [Salvelinus namaycush]|uniref:Protein rapunzel-like isoform X1 n=1 Tax=Salvelinus namaycush TaxID=8040 RepID=A0A8U0UE42_SALNM|nr:protein rapunzel-like isoform X1 [Salvelinus namaycush]XP_038850261.1 protein rapunzel-like isoform X1 [Salvelinus namaycush]XP_038850262.1 protein rapunzel-like isoform X1 [Salvelinus namaycush]XP_038850267.1 protein rapunzel-like isoform X1 [Salvelinus namaycush]XP_038850268.1 protein rapunzel-like isoform X1 [Salvelinus namaycush]XP_038850269.1 protein rapunzel-like isoform X1 [Salvelinus namaycush]